ncbi:MAG: phosphoenolpyruvate--protein phosphotransferase [Blautia sp.]|nr:phosphoenolpyruvate--protein phosphotransferase [Blautia sp.]
MEIFKGRSAFAEIAIGKIVYYSRGEYQIRQYMVNNIDHELQEFRRAAGLVEEALSAQYESRQDERCLEQKQILSEESFRKAVECVIRLQNVSAGYAVRVTRDEMVETFRNLSDDFIRRRIRNVRDLCNRLLSALGQNYVRISLGDGPVILVAEDLAPYEIMEMEKEQLAAVVTSSGSDISHAAIMAKTMNIPVLYDIPVQDDWDGHTAIVDGYTGNLYIDPDREVQKEYTLRQEENREEREELLKLRDDPDVTADGKEVPLQANIADIGDISSVRYYGAAGIGLLRSEFQYMGRENFPREEELFRQYRALAEAMEGKLTIIRTADLGADKSDSYMKIPEERNPIMGNRGIRLSLDRGQMFRTQLQAVYRAACCGNLAVMYPMITSSEELHRISQYIEQVKENLRSRSLPFGEPKQGIMVETPAAVMMAGELAEDVDFLSIGTNDLTQYTLAMDRQDPYLQDKYDDHHPAVLKMIRMVIDAGHAAGKPVYICGELAADTTLTETFVQMGVDALSVVPACILPVRKALRKSYSRNGNREC